ncbi:MAG TPA: tetratricopeptide repeat protein [Thermoanaerobaculia bacterium]|nr:tetratricopeptide repeat protein [Thermoanaerobaculia bacterium]
MNELHLDAARLDELVRLNDHRLQKDFLLHHLEVCPECGAAGAHLLAARRAGRLPSRYSPVEAELAKSLFEAPALWERLHAFSPEKRRGLVQDTDRFLSWGLCELLCQQSREAVSGDPEEALELAELAVLVARRLPPGQPVEEEWLEELRAYAWASLGNARRVLGELRSADEAFFQADEHWALGAAEIGDPLGFGASILGLKASLRRAQRRFEDALALLDQAVETYLQGNEELRDLHLAGRALVKKAYTLDQMGEPTRAIEALKEAVPLLDPARDPRTLLCLRHNLVDSLSKTGRFHEASALLPEVETLSREVGSDLDLLRLRWAEGRIAAGLGEAEKGEEILRQVRRDFVERGLGYDAALVSLELAGLYAKQERTMELKELAGEMLPIFQSRDVHREALAALALFQQAASREEASLDLVERIATYLGRARRDPGLRFEGAVGP